MGYVLEGEGSESGSKKKMGRGRQRSMGSEWGRRKGNRYERVEDRERMTEKGWREERSSKRKS